MIILEAGKLDALKIKAPATIVVLEVKGGRVRIGVVYDREKPEKVDEKPESVNN